MKYTQSECDERDDASPFMFDAKPSKVKCFSFIHWILSQVNHSVFDLWKCVCTYWVGLSRKTGKRECRLMQAA